VLRYAYLLDPSGGIRIRICEAPGRGGDGFDARALFTRIVKGVRWTFTREETRDAEERGMLSLQALSAASLIAASCVDQMFKFLRC
jgi:hypothetical protein